MFSANGWLGLDVLKAIECKIGSERAIVILNLFFGRPKETTQSRWNEQSDVEENGTTNPGIIMSRRHVGFCIACERIIVPRRLGGDRVKREVHQIGLLILDTKGEVCRLI